MSDQPGLVPLAPATPKEQQPLVKKKRGRRQKNPDGTFVSAKKPPMPKKQNAAKGPPRKVGRPPGSTSKKNKKLKDAIDFEQAPHILPQPATAAPIQSTIPIAPVASSLSPTPSSSLSMGTAAQLHSGLSPSQFYLQSSPPGHAPSSAIWNSDGTAQAVIVPPTQVPAPTGAVVPGNSSNNNAGYLFSLSQLDMDFDNGNNNNTAPNTKPELHSIGNQLYQRQQRVSSGGESASARNSRIMNSLRSGAPNTEQQQLPQQGFPSDHVNPNLLLTGLPTKPAPAVGVSNDDDLLLPPQRYATPPPAIIRPPSTANDLDDTISNSSTPKSKLSSSIGAIGASTSSPCTPKTFSSIMHSSPLYPAFFYSSPAVGGTTGGFGDSPLAGHASLTGSPLSEFLNNTSWDSINGEEEQSGSARFQSQAAGKPVNGIHSKANVWWSSPTSNVRLQPSGDTSFAPFRFAGGSLDASIDMDNTTMNHFPQHAPISSSVVLPQMMAPILGQELTTPAAAEPSTEPTSDSADLPPATKVILERAFAGIKRPDFETVARALEWARLERRRLKKMKMHRHKHRRSSHRHGAIEKHKSAPIAPTETPKKVLVDLGLAELEVSKPESFSTPKKGVCDVSPGNLAEKLPQIEAQSKNAIESMFKRNVSVEGVVDHRTQVLNVATASAESNSINAFCTPRRRSKGKRSSEDTFGGPLPRPTAQRIAPAVVTPTTTCDGEMGTRWVAGHLKSWSTDHSKYYRTNPEFGSGQQSSMAEFPATPTRPAYNNPFALWGAQHESLSSPSLETEIPFGQFPFAVTKSSRKVRLSVSETGRAMLNEGEGTNVYKRSAPLFGKISSTADTIGDDILLSASKAKARLGRIKIDDETAAGGMGSPAKGLRQRSPLKRRFTDSSDNDDGSGGGVQKKRNVSGSSETLKESCKNAAVMASGEPLVPPSLPLPAGTDPHDSSANSSNTSSSSCSTSDSSSGGCSDSSSDEEYEHEVTRTTNNTTTEASLDNHSSSGKQAESQKHKLKSHNGQQGSGTPLRNNLVLAPTPSPIKMPGSHYRSPFGRRMRREGEDSDSSSIMSRHGSPFGSRRKQGVPTPSSAALANMLGGGTRAANKVSMADSFPPVQQPTKNVDEEARKSNNSSSPGAMALSSSSSSDARTAFLSVLGQTTTK